MYEAYRNSLGISNKKMADAEEVLTVDASSLTGLGYGLDIGGSLAKLAYVTKVKGQPDKRHIHLKTFLNTELDELIDFVSKNCDLGPPQSKVIVTGFGSLFNKKKLEAALNMKLDLRVEFDCLMRTLVWSAKHLPLSQFCFPRDDQAYMAAMEAVMNWAKIGVDIATGNDDTKAETKETSPQADSTNTQPTAPPEPINYHVSDLEGSCDHFPCLVVSLGSATAFYIAFESGNVQMVDASNTGGRSLMALSNLLIGTTDFEEFMELAARGDISGVDVCGSHMKKGVPDDPAARLYTSYPDAETAYYLGQATNSKGPFDRADLAASLLRNFCVQMVNMAQLLCKAHGLRRIYFLGSGPGHPHMRSVMERYMQERMAIMERANNDIKFGFVRRGGAYGAIGTLLS